MVSILKQDYTQRDVTNVEPLEAENVVTHLSEQTVHEAVKEIIHLPTFGGHTVSNHHDIELNPVVLNQLENYVSTVASMYRDNPFHNF